MADRNLLPKRPENDNFPMINQRDKDCLSFAVAFAVPNQRAYGYFHPEFCDTSGKLTELGRKQSSQFFSYAKHKEYCDAYRETLTKFLNGDSTRSEAPLLEIDDKRKDNARIALYNKVIKLIEGDGDLDPDTLKIAVDMAKKLSIVADDIEVQEAPRRYLPQRCSSCDYRSFVESCVETGQVENSCLRCRALDLAKEHGFMYDPKNLLRDNGDDNTDTRI